jgi:lysine 2,3-aminomutase
MMLGTEKPTYYQRFDLWKDVPPEKWNDWRWQLKNAISTVEQLEKVIPLTEKEKGEIEKARKYSRFIVLPYYLSLIDRSNPECPIRLSAIPQIAELEKGMGELKDPLAEDRDSPVPRLVHRYPDRVLFLVSEICSMYCRFCTRRRLVLDRTAEELDAEHDKALDYIAKHPEVRDVILSGGDALMLNENQLEGILKKLRAIPHVEIIRVASRMPCVFPMRITDKLCQMLAKYHPIYFMTHFNHPYEVTWHTRQACERIVSAGMPILNQTVLLKKINSDPYIMKSLAQKLLSMRVQPYYIFQCDLAQGIEHFRTSVSKGMEIMEYLRGHTSGIAIPTYVIDAPGGGGKVPVMPNYLLTLSDDCAVMRNYKGTMSAYVNPTDREASCSTTQEVRETLTPEKPENRPYLDLMEGKRVTLKPK